MRVCPLVYTCVCVRLLFHAHLFIGVLLLNLLYLIRQSALSACDEALFAQPNGWVCDGLMSVGLPLAIDVHC